MTDMSQWTHIAGIIRYDDLMRDRAQAHKEMLIIEDEFFRDAPHGSEGPMEYTIIPTHEYKQDGNVTSYGSGLCDVAFGGDFRDFSQEDWPKLREWFDKATTSEGLDVRQGVILIQDDDYPVALQEVITFKETPENVLETPR